MSNPRTFRLVRGEDVTGVSGTGHVADGVEWPDGTVTVKWRGEFASEVSWPLGMVAVERVHGHDGRTRVVWHDDVELPTPGVPGYEGTVGPGRGAYHRPHVYARDVQSGSGNCVCGGALGDWVHTEAAPGVPVPADRRPRRVQL